ncbi:unnamed protein product [Nippostrongylus brasiliensis]|uniref:Uncharacterized protein n=1 Tax=Nippostrongylus brasiliensis TaxID=27835 RepID=A0A0N4XIF2_NIPBR|nr:unnamed protein product [Nippostrongylus brasiliensis]
MCPKSSSVAGRRRGVRKGALLHFLFHQLTRCEEQLARSAFVEDSRPQEVSPTPHMHRDVPRQHKEEIATVPTTSAPRSVTPDSSAPKFFPLGQTTLAPAPHFADTIPPATVTYPFQMRRMTTFVQPVTPRRDLRFSTPTPLAISKKTPIGVNLPSTDTVEESTRISEEVSERRDGIADESRNPEDSEDENEDGRTSPDVLSTSIRSNEDTWDFWDRVYSDPELRQSMQERQVTLH